MQMRDTTKPRVGIFGLTGCAGDQLVILNCEDELLSLVELLDIRDFGMASSEYESVSELDVAFVEGAVLSERDQRQLEQIRARSRILVAIGTCAVWGGIAAMDRDADRGRLLRETYGGIGPQLDTTPARALHEIVKVDVSISGCPIEKEHFLSATSNLLCGDLPLLPEYPVCLECKFAENNCLLVEKGEICLGPLTLGGCQARCPALGIACVGCRGPAPDTNLASALALFSENGLTREAVAKKLRTFAPVSLSYEPVE
jgi:sulfhydrogenase subunit delta